MSATAFERADKVFQVIGKTLLFFVDIEFLDVIDKFLFQAVLVIIHTQCLFKRIGDTVLYLAYPFLLVGSHRFEQPCYILYLLTEFLFERCALLLAEVYQMIDSLFHCRMHHCPFLIAQLLSLILRHYIRHTEQRGKPVGRFGNTGSRRNFLNPFVISLHQFLIDRSGQLFRIFLLNPKAEIDLAPFQHFGYFVTDFHFLFPVKRSNTGR